MWQQFEDVMDHLNARADELARRLLDFLDQYAFASGHMIYVTVDEKGNIIDVEKDAG